MSEEKQNKLIEKWGSVLDYSINGVEPITDDVDKFKIASLMEEYEDFFIRSDISREIMVHVICYIRKNRKMFDYIESIEIVKFGDKYYDLLVWECELPIKFVSDSLLNKNLCEKFVSEEIENMDQQDMVKGYMILPNNDQPFGYSNTHVFGRGWIYNSRFFYTEKEFEKFKNGLFV